MFSQITRLTCFLLIFLFLVSSVIAESKTGKQSYRRAHGHNDYRHPKPLQDALNQGFCSVEADIFLVDGKLLVGHSHSELRPERTLTSLYLEPLQKIIRQNKGRVHPDYPWFTLMIDIKSDPVSTYQTLTKKLARFNNILTSVINGKVTHRAVRVIISGNRAWDEIESAPIRFCGIDGRLKDLESPKPAHLMPMISDNWKLHFRWQGKGPFPIKEKNKLDQIIRQAHQAGRIVRFWNTPEKETVWKVLYNARIDLINTDHLSKLNSFLKDQDSESVQFHPEFESGQRLPQVMIRNKKSHIHTQGLHVTKKFYYVTGRLNEAPRRALLLRFLRSDPSQYEYVDITPSEEFTKRNQGTLDHPGGFDSDGKHLWIPISASRRKSLSVIVKVPINENESLDKEKAETVFEFQDHIGAIAINPETKLLYGANWDTLISYTWSLKGELINKIPQNEMIQQDPEQKIAVQDWKSLGNGILLMSGKDRSLNCSPLASRAILEIVDMNSQQRIGKARIFGPDLHSIHLTHEGFSFDQNYLYFLPRDIGSGATVYQYRWNNPVK